MTTNFKLDQLKTRRAPWPPFNFAPVRDSSSSSTCSFTCSSCPPAAAATTVAAAAAAATAPRPPCPPLSAPTTICPASVLCVATCNAKARIGQPRRGVEGRRRCGLVPTARDNKVGPGTLLELLAQGTLLLLGRWRALMKNLLSHALWDGKTIKYTLGACVDI